MSLIGQALVFKPKCLKLEPSCGHFPKWLQFLNMRKNSFELNFSEKFSHPFFPKLFSFCMITLGTSLPMYYMQYMYLLNFIVLTLWFYEL